MNSRLTYRQLKEEVDSFATAMADLGVGKDTKVAIQLPNLPQTVIAYYATLSLGAQAVMTNPAALPSSTPAPFTHMRGTNGAGAN